MKRLSRLLVFLFALGLLAWAPGVHAEYEITGVVCNVRTDGTVVPMPEDDVVVSWTKPTMSGDDVLQGFVYLWNDKPGDLSDAELSATANNGIVSDDLDPPSLTKPATDFANDDSDDLWYLHIKTWYLDAPSNLTYSADTVIGPINIDNVAPTGTVRITDADGNDITETRNTNLNLRLSASGTPVKMYLSENSTKPTTGADFFAEAAYQLDNAEPGTKTIYAWFEDSVGNYSSAPATDTVTLLGPVSISPYQATMDLATANTKVFGIDGSSANYDWEIIDAVPETAGDTVAEIADPSTNTNAITVTALSPGTFKLKATITDGIDSVTSGTITVVQSVLYGDVSGNGTINAYDASLAAQFGVGLIQLDTLQQIAADVSGSGTVNAYDASLIAQKAVGLIDKFPVE